MSDPQLPDRGGVRLQELARPVVEYPPYAPTPVEGLRRRMRRRRQRFGATAGVLVVALAALTLWIAAPFGSDRSIDTRPSARTPTVPSPSGPVGAVPTDAPPIGAMHLWSPRDGYAVNGLGLYVTDDAGAHWRNIAPADTYDPIGHMTAIDVLDSQHVWTSWALNSHPVNNYRTTDGGRSWTTDATCGSEPCPIFTAISFADPQRGWALSGSDQSPPTGALYATTDGGAHWSAVGQVPFNGQVTFGDAQHGWGRTGPHGIAGNGADADTGGALFRTDDGGHTWTPVDPLDAAGKPTADATYSMPQSFGPAAIVAAWVPGRAPTPAVQILSTSDWGATWTAKRAPRTATAARYRGDTGFPVAAVDPADVVYYPGGNLYANKGFNGSWTTVRPRPTWSRIEALEFTTPEHGWAIVLNRGCTDKPANLCTYSILVSTDDGGRTWSILAPQ